MLRHHPVARRRTPEVHGVLIHCTTWVASLQLALFSFQTNGRMSAFGTKWGYCLAHCTCPLFDPKVGHCVLEFGLKSPKKMNIFRIWRVNVGRRTLQREFYSQNIIHFIFVPETLGGSLPVSSSCWCAVSSRTQQCPLMTQSGYPNYQNLIASSASIDFCILLNLTRCLVRKTHTTGIKQTARGNPMSVQSSHSASTRFCNPVKEVAMSQTVSTSITRRSVVAGLALTAAPMSYLDGGEQCACAGQANRA